MKPDPVSTQQALLNARQAVLRGDRQTARRWAEMVAALSPELEESWLILAAVASPRASVVYLERALKINPTSERARKGMHWAVERLRKEAVRKPTQNHSLADTQPGRLVREGATRPSSKVESTPRPTGERRLPSTVTNLAPATVPYPSKSVTKYRWSFLTLLVLIVCVSAAWVFWPGNASPVRAFLHVPQFTPLVFGAPAEVDKPTYTPTFTPTFTPTETFTPTPTFTFTPTPTETYTPTETFVPTRTRRPTEPPPPAPTETPYSYTDNGNVRWIDVNLSQQMLYAYEGDTVVASFLVSTGVPAFPTVTGQYHIYIKLISTLMAGDGYYLPGVPYTMYFYKGYGIHGTYWHHNFGHPMSHGCVNMYTPDAEWMFYWASVGTLVNVHY
jgi:lipoprotein-anchoring transpeptidase ErfK/SrfK